MKRRPRVKAVLLVGLLVVMVNLPLVHSTYTDWRVEHAGTDVTGRVTGTGVLPPEEDPDYVVSFQLPEQIDPEQQNWTAEVDRSTYEQASEERTIAVRVLPDRPSAFTTEGQVTHRSGLYFTLFADLALLAVVALLWRYRGTLRAPLHAVAVGDVERCAPGALLEKTDGGVYLIRGEVSEIGEDELVLDLVDRSVRVTLDGHHNPVGHQQPAQVRGRLIG